MGAAHGTDRLAAPRHREAADWLRAEAAGDDLVLVDESTYYLDIPWCWHPGFRRRSCFAPAGERISSEGSFARATLAVLVEHGRLGHFKEDRFEFRDLPFCAAQRYNLRDRVPPLRP